MSSGWNRSSFVSGSFSGKWMNSPLPFKLTTASFVFFVILMGSFVVPMSQNMHGFFTLFGFVSIPLALTLVFLSLDYDKDAQKITLIAFSLFMGFMATTIIPMSADMHVLWGIFAWAFIPLNLTFLALTAYDPPRIVRSEGR